MKIFRTFPWFAQTPRTGYEEEVEKQKHPLPVHWIPSPVKPSGQGPQSKPDASAGGCKSMHWIPG